MSAENQFSPEAVKAADNIASFVMHPIGGQTWRQAAIEVQAAIDAATSPLCAQLADLREGRSVVLPKTALHARQMMLVAEASLK